MATLHLQTLRRLLLWLLNLFISKARLLTTYISIILSKGNCSGMLQKALIQNQVTIENISNSQVYNDFNFFYKKLVLVHGFVKVLYVSHLLHYKLSNTIPSMIQHQSGVSLLPFKKKKKKKLTVRQYSPTQNMNPFKPFIKQQMVTRLGTQPQFYNSYQHALPMGIIALSCFKFNHCFSSCSQFFEM